MNELVPYEDRTFQSIQIPAWGIIPGGENVDWRRLREPFPKRELSYRQIGGKDYFYPPVDRVMDRLDQCFQVWTYVVTGIWKRPFSYEREDKRTKAMETVEGEEIGTSIRLLAPGLPTMGILGEGSFNYYPKNLEIGYGDALKSAESNAITNAALKRLGVGGRPNEALDAALESLRATIATLVSGLKQKERVDALLKRMCPQALEGGEFLPNLIADDQLDELQKALLLLAREK